MEYNSEDSKVELLVSKWEKRTYFLIAFTGLLYIILMIDPILERNIRGILLMLLCFSYIFWKIIIKLTSAEANAILYMSATVLLLMSLIWLG